MRHPVLLIIYLASVKCNPHFHLKVILYCLLAQLHRNGRIGEKIQTPFFLFFYFPFSLLWDDRTIYRDKYVLDGGWGASKPFLKGFIPPGIKFISVKICQDTPGTSGWSRLRDRTLAVKSRKIKRKSAFVKKTFWI